MNIFGYQMVLRKYKKNPRIKVENNTNDMVMLYLCKTYGCFGVALCFCYMLAFMGAFYTGKVFLFALFILFLSFFKNTPSVKKGVRTIQERYVYSNFNTKKS